MQSDESNVTVESTAVPEPGAAVVGQMMETEPDPTTLNLFAEDVNYVRALFSEHNINAHVTLWLMSYGNTMTGDVKINYMLRLGHEDDMKAKSHSVKQAADELLRRWLFKKRNEALCLPRVGKLRAPEVDDDIPF